ncbi:MAG: glutamate synthase subunit alpha [Bdellovibrionales bacterium]|nr:glutamate synthase subunit alpha [Bdellovibrionales bacterium]
MWNEQGLYCPQFEHDACGVGFIAQLNAKGSHLIVDQALTMLANLEHRGGVGSDPATSDGAGILLDIPHAYFASVLPCALPERGTYGVAMLYLPREEGRRAWLEQLITEAVEAEAFEIVAWRTVPVVSEVAGRLARTNEPLIRQLFVRSRITDHPEELERRLYILRRVLENSKALREAAGAEHCYVASFSSKTIVYKGLLPADRIGAYFSDLACSEVSSRFAIVHQRYSTNTFPSWSLAHPFRLLAHNGEINTLRGNLTWMRAREELMSSPLFGDDLRKVLPLMPPGRSDSAYLDAALELLLHGGRTLPHALAMLIPEAWEEDRTMDARKRAFYEYHSFLMEPWDGPASLVCTDGTFLAATLDRNGLRPSRFTITTDGLVVLGSETGALPIAADRVLQKGRLEPGKMLLLDFESGRLVPDEELKATLAERRPYGDWLATNVLRLTVPEQVVEEHPPRALFRMFGYTAEDLQVILQPMAETGQEPLGSMGADTPLAVFSDLRPLLYGYFKQLFAQVTNPPLDAIRERMMTSLRSVLGCSGNLLDEETKHCRQLVLDAPVIAPAALEAIKALSSDSFPVVTLRAVYPIGEEEETQAVALEEALMALCLEAEGAVRGGAVVLILSDRVELGKSAPLPALLACAAVHHHLIRLGLRMRCGIVVESGEPREVHHFALLVGYGAGAVCPYLALAALRYLVPREESTAALSRTKFELNYLDAANKGVLKVMSKMGISTLQSYRGAQIFEAVGLATELVERHFSGTPSRIGGATLGAIALENVRRHRAALSDGPDTGQIDFPQSGEYQWRRGGVEHLNEPLSLALLQRAARENCPRSYRQFADTVNAQHLRMGTLRSLLEFAPQRDAIPLDEVEPASEIAKRFRSGAMSFGSISFEAHATLAIAMNRLGAKSNTGEGGEDPLRMHAFDSIDAMREAFRHVSPWVASLLTEGDSARSAIKQVASARFGVTSEYLVHADELQIKIAQGAKPGEGGQLPGHKVDAWIGRVRHATPGVGLISPPPHHDIYSIEDLAQLIHDLKNANPAAAVSVKLVAAIGVGTVAAGVAKGRADVILISGAEGGTGASPLSSIRHAGLPWELGLAETQQVLSMNGLRERVRLEVDGQLRTGRDVAIAALLGAEEFGFATAPLIALGCVMMRKCHLNTCPVGVATQNPVLRKRFNAKPDDIVNYLLLVAEDVRQIMASLGFRTIDEMVGRTEFLRAGDTKRFEKAGTLNLDVLLHRTGERTGVEVQAHGIEENFDSKVLLPLVEAALEQGEQVSRSFEIRNVHRSVGTRIGSEVTRRCTGQPLDPDRLHFKFHGSAGQSFGAFIPQGVTLELVGDANDYVGKGLSGGTVIVYPPAEISPNAGSNVIIGNVALYGATGGAAWIRGIAGERFGVRNSGADAVVEGIGAHGCEYMTGGRVVVLGPVGRNFAAGMSGGIAYVLDPGGEFRATRCNRELVLLERVVDHHEQVGLRSLIERHASLTGSAVARDLLSSWGQAIEQFVRVISAEYKAVTEGGWEVAQQASAMAGAR